jgi:hypothetical protein
MDVSPRRANHKRPMQNHSIKFESIITDCGPAFGSVGPSSKEATLKGDRRFSACFKRVCEEGSEASSHASLSIFPVVWQVFCATRNSNCIRQPPLDCCRMRQTFPLTSVAEKATWILWLAKTFSECHFIHSRVQPMCKLIPHFNIRRYTKGQGFPSTVGPDRLVNGSRTGKICPILERAASSVRNVFVPQSANWSR